MEAVSYDGLVAAYVAGHIIAALFAIGLALMGAAVVVRAVNFVLDAIDR